MSDSGPNIKAAVQRFHGIHQMPCTAHKLNSSVTDLFKPKAIKERVGKDRLVEYSIFDLNEDGDRRKLIISSEEKAQIELTNSCKETTNQVISRGRKLVGAFRHSEVLTRQLKSKQIELKYESRTKLVQEVPTRWNSTFCMIDSILVNRDALVSLSISEKAVAKLILQHDDFNFLDELSNVLLPLYDLTCSLSGHYYSTSSLLYPSLYRLLNYDMNEMVLVFPEVDMLKNQLLRSIQTRFKLILENDLFLAATYLNFKCKRFESVSYTHLTLPTKRIV